MQITVNGRRVTVSDDFRSLSPEMQDATVDEIAAAMGGGEPRAQGAPAQAAPMQQAPMQQAPMQAPPQQQRAAQVPQMPMFSPVSFGEGVINSIPVAGPWLKDQISNARGAISGAFGGPSKEEMDAQVEFQRQAFPAANVAGQVAGSIAPFAVGGAIPGVSRVLGMSGSVPSQVAFGAGSAAAITGADTLARGGSMGDALGTGGTAAAIAGAVPLAGKAISTLARGMRPPPGVPEISDLQAAKNAAYQMVDNSGVRYSPQAYDELLSDMIQRVSADNISPTRHQAAFDMLSDLEGRRGRPLSLTQLDQIRQEIWRDVAGKTSPDAAGDAHFGKLMVAAIDDFIENANPGQLIAGDPRMAQQAITTARQANSTLRKSEALQNMIEDVQRQVAATGSGGNIDNRIRQSLNGLLKNRRIRWTEAERKAITEVIKGGGRMQDLMRLLGKLSPSGNGLMAALGLGGTIANPAMAVLPGIGLVAKTVADGATKRGIGGLTQQVRTGGQPIPRVPEPLPLPPGAVPSLLLPRPERQPVQISVGTRGAPTYPYP